MAAVPPEAYGPPPHLINNHLIEALHRAIRIHPHAESKSLYGKILAQLLAAQVRERQAAQAAPPQNVPLPHGAVADAGPDAAGPPVDWAAVARGNPPISLPEGAPLPQEQFALISNPGHVYEPLPAAALAGLRALAHVQPHPFTPGY